MKDVIAISQFFRAGNVTQLMKHFATTMVHGLFRDGLVLQKSNISFLLTN